MSNALFKLAAPLATEAPQIFVGDDAWPVRLVHHARSRRYRLVFDAARAVPGDRVTLGVRPEHAEIGANVVIHAGTVIGAGCVIQDNVVLRGRGGPLDPQDVASSH